MASATGVEERDSELLLEFVEECGEQIDHTEQALLAFEQNPASARAGIATALRCLHSIKGSAGYVSLFDVQELCHAAEDLIGKLGSFDARRAKLAADLALDGVTLLRERLDEVRDACEDERDIRPSAGAKQWLARVQDA